LKAVLLAAGFGTRLTPLSQSIPKPMIKILGKPILEHIIFRLSKYGVNEFLIITGHLGQQIQNYFGNGEQFNVKISYIDQIEIKGTGHATQLSEHFVDDASFLVYLADTLIPNLDSFFSSLKNKEFEVELVSSLISSQQSSASGIINIKNNLVVELNEKPVHSDSSLSWAGIAYFKSKKIFEILNQTPISSRKELEITDAMNLMIKNNYLIKNHNVSKYFDSGTPNGLLEIMNYLLSVSNISKNYPSSFISPVFYSSLPIVGKNSKVGPNVSIGDNVLIGDHVEISNSLILDNSVIKSGKKISNSIIFGQSDILY
jgi:NDP-sugar pyrophosphorylase family protein